MMENAQAVEEEKYHAIGEVNDNSLNNSSDQLVEEQQYRSGAYRILAALLNSAPSQQLMGQVSGFSTIEAEGDELAMTMRMLGLSASSSKIEQVDDEFHGLFIGLGRGELMPYGSWYLTGFLMERTLSSLRDDVAALGYQRKTDIHEPEDHASALCDVMAMMIDDDISQQKQADFFNKHMLTWFKQFFSDLSHAKSATFYKSVGRFGIAFTDFEEQYLAMQV